LKKLRFSDPSFPSDITLALLPDGKVLANLAQPNFHYTFQPGHFSGEVDLHRTNEAFPEGDPSRHERLGAVPRTSILSALDEIGPQFLGEFVRLWRPVRLDSVIRQGLVVGARIPTDSEVAGVKKISIRSGPACSAEPFARLTKAPEFYEDMLQPPFAAYLLFKPERSLFAVTFPYARGDGTISLRWAKMTDIRHWQTRWEAVLWDMGERILVS
jgi:hypothetical protein